MCLCIYEKVISCVILTLRPSNRERNGYLSEVISCHHECHLYLHLHKDQTFVQGS